MSSDAMMVAQGGVQAAPDDLQPGIDGEADEEYRPLMTRGGSKNCLICEGIEYRYKDRVSKGQINTPRYDILEFVKRHSSSGDIDRITSAVQNFYNAIKDNILVKDHTGKIKVPPYWSKKSIRAHFRGLHATQNGVDPLNFTINHAIAGAQAAQECMRCADGSINKVAAEIHISYLKAALQASQAKTKRDQLLKTDRPVPKVKNSFISKKKPPS